MKKVIIFLSLFAFLFILLISLILADIFSIGYSAGGGEFAVGGGPFTGIPEEAPAPPVSPPSEGKVVEGPSFNLDKTFLLIQIRTAEHQQQKITISNDGGQDLTVNISIIDIKKFVFTHQETFTLRVGESKTIIFDIYVSEREKTDTYIGKIDFASGNIVKSVNIVLEVRERAPLFDIKTTLLRKIFFPGQKVTASVEILNLGDLKNIDVELESYITDSKKNVYSPKKESFAINDFFAEEVFIMAPKDIEPGQYTFHSKVSYKDISANSYDTLKIVKKPFIGSVGELVFYLIILILITLTILILVLLISRSKGKEENY